MTELSFYIFGPGVGESIVVRLPGRRWGVVDCYAEADGEEAMSDPVHWLEEQGVTELEFLCWTHPHADHSNGLPALLRAYDGRIHELWRFDAEHPARWLAYASLWSNKIRDAIHREVPSYLVEVFRVFENRRKRGRGHRLLRPNGLLWSDDSYDLEIRALAPAENARLDFNAQLDKIRSARGEPLVPPSRFPFNLISGALWLRYADAEFILGGDVERRGWRESWHELDRLPGPCKLVKAPHHGSEGAYFKPLWSAVGPDKNPGPAIAITPFADSDLPRPEGIRKLAKHGPVYVTTAGSAPVSMIGDLLLAACAETTARTTSGGAPLSFRWIPGNDSLIVAGGEPQQLHSP